MRLLLALQGNVDEHVDGTAGFLLIDERRIPFDEAALLERADTPQTSRFREADALGKLAVSRTAVGLQSPDDRAVIAVKFHIWHFLASDDKLAQYSAINPAQRGAFAGLPRLVRLFCAAWRPCLTRPRSLATPTRSKPKMKIGVPKEIKIHEYRVGLVPAGVLELARAGHQVLVETGAGSGIGFEDAHYRAAGATIAAHAAEIFTAADLIVKVKEPQISECKQLRRGQILFTYLHLAADREQALALIASGATAIAYETVTAPDGSLPLLTPMSEVAGRMSVQVGAHCLQKANGGFGVLLGGVPGVAPAKVVVLGGGVSGTHAAEMAVGLCADGTVVDRAVKRRRELAALGGNRRKTEYSTAHAIEQLVRGADLVIGAVL